MEDTEISQRYNHIRNQHSRMIDDLTLYGHEASGSYRNIFWKMKRISSGHWMGIIKLSSKTSNFLHHRLCSLSHRNTLIRKKAIEDGMDDFIFYLTDYMDYPSQYCEQAPLSILFNITYKDHAYALSILKSIIDEYRDFIYIEKKFLNTKGKPNCQNIKQDILGIEYNIWEPSPFAHSFANDLKVMSSKF